MAGILNNVTIEDNTLSDNSHASGIRILACPDVQVVSNNVTDHLYNIAVLGSDGALLLSNICSYAETDNILVRASGNVTLCSNLCNHGEDGIEIEGTMDGLEVNDNAMTYCARGLVYTQDAMAPPQIEKGNYFLSNTLGAEFEEVSDPLIIYSMRYEVRSLATEYPSFSPENWFLPNGTEALNCTPMAELPPIEHTDQVKRLIAGIDDLTPDGKVTNDFMIALEKIAAEPDFLEDEDIEDFYETFSGTALDSLLTIRNIAVIRQSYATSVPVIVFDEEGAMSANLSSHFSYLEDMQEAYAEADSVHNAMLSQALQDMESLIPANSFEEKYQFAIIQYLGLLLGDTLTVSDELDILELAEGCLADDGPGVYVAQIVAETEHLLYEKASGCTPVTQRSYTVTSSVNGSDRINVFPNPANEQIELSLPLHNATISIYDLTGRLSYTDKNVEGNRINISSLIPGIYALHIAGRSERVQFVKL